MLSAKIFAVDWDVDQRLIPFGVMRSELLTIVRAVVAARADAVEDDPLTAEGQFAYIFGTRGTRRVFCAKGYLRHRHENIESVRHPDRPLKIVYQSVDLAGSHSHTPKAISGKGSGSDRVIDAAQGSLFPSEDKPRVVAQIDTGIWYFCVSVHGDDVRAELSLPIGIANGNFEGFIERIFVVRDGEWGQLDQQEASDTDPAEFEPVISRK